MLDLLLGRTAARVAARGCPGVGESPVSTVTFHRLDELLAGVGQARRDDMQDVVGASSGHADVDGCRIERVGQDRVRSRDGRVLHPVGGRCVGQVRVLLHVPGGRGHRVLTLATIPGLVRPDGAVVPDALDGEGLPVRHP